MLQECNAAGKVGRAKCCRGVLCFRLVNLYACILPIFSCRLFGGKFRAETLSACFWAAAVAWTESSRCERTSFSPGLHCGLHHNITDSFSRGARPGLCFLSLGWGALEFPCSEVHVVSQASLDGRDAGFYPIGTHECSRQDEVRDDRNGSGTAAVFDVLASEGQQEIPQVSLASMSHWQRSPLQESSRHCMDLDRPETPSAQGAPGPI